MDPFTAVSPYLTILYHMYHIVSILYHTLVYRFSLLYVSNPWPGQLLIHKHKGTEYECPILWNNLTSNYSFVIHITKCYYKTYKRDIETQTQNFLKIKSQHDFKHLDWSGAFTILNSIKQTITREAFDPSLVKHFPFTSN